MILLITISCCFEIQELCEFMHAFYAPLANPNQEIIFKNATFYLYVFAFWIESNMRKRRSIYIYCFRNTFLRLT